MQICEKKKVYNTNVDLVYDNVYTKFGLNLSIRSQDIEQKQILTAIKGRNSVANLRKTMIYITNVDLVNDYVYTKLILVSIGLFVFKMLSKNSILTLIKGRNSIANLPTFEFIQAFMHVFVSCKNEEGQIENEGARLYTRFLPSCLCGFFQALKGS